MSRILIIIGGVIFSLIMYAIPILCVCSLVYHWDGPVQTGLISLCVGQIILLVRMVIWQAMEEM